MHDTVANGGPACPLAKAARAANVSRMEEHPPRSGWLHWLGRGYRIACEAYSTFNAADGWAIASHIALSALMALFPFLIVVVALAGFFGSRELADEAARILLEAWPEEVAAPIALEIHGVLTSARGDILTIGVAFAIFFASSGVESLRIALNRSYAVIDKRNWLLLRLESIGYVLIGAVALLVFSLLVVLAPLMWNRILRFLPDLEPFGVLLTFVRFGIAAIVLIAALVIAHLWLPAGRRRLRDIIPGILATLVLWLVSGAIFGRYLAEFAFSYFNMYAGLASAVIALFFLYITASIFIYGGDLNAAVLRERERETDEHRAS
jgi:membrane protein